MEYLKALLVVCGTVVCYVSAAEKIQVELPYKYPHLHNKTVPRMTVREETTITMRGGEFTMGVKDPTSRTGEYPPRRTEVKPFIMDKFPVTVADYMAFKRFKGKYRTAAENAGWSWVFLNHVSEFAVQDPNRTHPHDEKWFVAVQGASWKKPYGLADESVKQMEFPVTHVTYYDALAFCQWQNKRLPSEAEWEYAARGNRKGERYPWGERYERKRMNVWQGMFPTQNRKLDGYDGLAPVKAFPAQNDFNMFDMVGNAWEWTSTLFYYPDPPQAAGMEPPHNKPEFKRRYGQKYYTVKGGSFVDSKDGTVNLEARCAARQMLAANYSAENVGFRCAKTLLQREKPVEEDNHHHHSLRDTARFRQGSRLDDGQTRAHDGSMWSSARKGLAKILAMKNMKQGKQEL